MKTQVQFLLFLEHYKVLLRLSLVLHYVLQFLERANLDKRLRDINLTCYVNKDFIVQVLVCTRDHSMKYYVIKEWVGGPKKVKSMMT